MHDVESRLTMYRLFGAPRAGLCAQAVRAALGAPWQGLADATEVAAAVPASQMHRDNAPAGSIVYWRGGARGHGHTCFALGRHLELSVDVDPTRPGQAGVVPFSWFAQHWPKLEYVGWSWYWGRLDTRPEILTPPGAGR